VLVELAAIAVKLHLVHPVRTLRGIQALGWDARFDE
jgi:hypothetical protein